MESMARPLGKIHADAAWFARATELRLLYVCTSADLGDPAIGVVMAQENHADNKSLWFRFDDPEVSGPPVWNDRSKRLHAQFSNKRRGLLEAGIAIGDVGPEPQPQPNGLEAFSTLLGKVLDALASPIHGAVLVFSPVRVDKGSKLRSELPIMARTLHARGVRLVVLERDTKFLAGLPAAVGEQQSLSCEAMVDPNALAADMAAAAGVAPVGAPPLPAIRWKGPGAGPDVVPPPRVGDIPPPTDEALVAAGLSPAYVRGGADQLKELVIGAALRVRSGDLREAIRMQADAAALCEGFAMPRLQIVNLIVLASYCQAAQAQTRAIEVYQKASTLAVQHAELDQAAQIELGLGSLDVRAGRPAQAITHYRKAGEFAEQAKMPSLAIEVWRMAGQLAVDHESDEGAVVAWKRALAVAGPLSPEEAKGTSAAEAARGLAVLLRKRKLHAQAASMEEMSCRLEHGLPPGTPVERA
jgi:tetratricopeptide (TPR) repeat protein